MKYETEPKPSKPKGQRLTYFKEMNPMIEIKQNTGSVEMAWWSRALVTLLGNANSILAPTWQLITICNSSPQGFDTFFRPAWVSGMYVVHRHTCKQNIHIIPINIT